MLFKRFCFSLLNVVLIFTAQLVVGQEYIVEAEDGTYEGASMTTYTEGQVVSVGRFEEDGDRLDIEVDVAVAGDYELIISYKALGSAKKQNLLLNDNFLSEISFDVVDQYAEVNVGKLLLDAGVNKISIEKSWGWSLIDKFVFTYSLGDPHDYSIVDQNLINSNADAKTVALYDFLKSNYGQKVLAGHHTVNYGDPGDYWTSLNDLVETPLIRGFDFQNYSPHNPWGNGSTEFKAWDDGTTQQAIDWYNSTGGCGVVTFNWHWLSPSGSALNEASFRTVHTSFDVTKAVDENTTEYTETIRDIDAIAVELKKLQVAGVPILWRPLHEAGGEWFWWGAKGESACLDLWDILYDRLTNFHGLNNLIWVWSTPEKEWYPGNDKVDVFGYDSYPGAFEYGSQRLVFNEMYEICEGEKIIALTENGPIPDIDLLEQEDAMWSFWATWANLAGEQNTDSHIQNSFDHAQVIHLENSQCGVIASEPFVQNTESNMVYPNPSNGVFYINKSTSYEVYNMLGVLMLKGEGDSINLSAYKNGLYIVHSENKTFKLIKH